MVEFSRRLKKLRTEMKLTQKQLAEQIGVQNSIISFYENGDRLPSPEIIIKLAAVLHVSTDYLMGVEPNDSVDVADLTESDIALVRSLIDCLRSKNQQIKN
jgi:transcriptional regulator with XRE-family HTH domain